MPQFDVFKNRRGGMYPLLLDVQADVLATLSSRVVVPLVSLKHFTRPIGRLHPTVSIGNTTYVMKFHDLASIPVAELGERVLSLAERRNDIIAALDLLFTGA